MLRNSLLTALLLCSFCIAATKKPQLPPKYKNWLQQEAVYIITDEEKKTFQTLDDDAARDEFIESFWDIRNPNRGSKINPYKEEHYRRIQYANEHFGRQSNTPGWMTDMGRTWILFGKPVSQHAFKGYGQIYPMELWFYENPTGLPSMPPFFYVMFFMPEDIGEYRFYRPYLDGPLKLVRGSNFNSNKNVYDALKVLGGDVAHAAFSLVPNDPIDTQDFTTEMGSDMLVSRIQNFSNDPFNVRRIREMRSLRSEVRSYFMVAQDRPLDINALVLADPTGRFWLDYGVLVDEAKLGKLDASTGQIKVSAAYRLTNEAGELIVEDSEDRAYPAAGQNATDKKFQPFVIANRIPIEPGVYKLTVEITNREAGQTFRGEQKLAVGGGNQVSMAGPLLVSSVEQAARPDALTPFQYFGVQFEPAAQRVFSHQNPLRLLFELRSPAADQNFQLEYVLANTHNREARRSFTEEVGHTEFKNGALLKSKSLPLADLENGEYRLVVNVRAAGSNQVVASVNVAFKIDDESVRLPLYVLTESRGFGRPGVAAYTRALEAIGQKNEPAALQYLGQALDQNPANSFAGQYLVQLYFNRRDFAPIAELYKRLGMDAFKSSPVTLAQISLSFRQAGDSTRAREVIVAAMNSFPDNPVVTAAAASLKIQAARPAR
jgi:GWxTD domain-containing protein